jgi:hypothetical protein
LPEEQGRKLLLSSEQANEAFNNPEKANTADVLLTKAAGDDDKSGDAGRTLHRAVAIEPVLPAASVCLTLNECDPSARPLKAFGLVHDE